MTTRKEFIFNYSLLLIGYIIIIFFFFYKLSDYQGDLFLRSGSILVIFSVIVEYRIVMSQVNKHQYKYGTSIKMSDLASAQNITTGEKLIKLISHISLILGTLIWGYGDIVIKTINH